MNQEKVKYIKQWLEKAEEDIAVVEILLVSEFPPFNSIGFHLQQAAEKFLKAFLEYHSQHFAKTHDIEYLLKACTIFNKEFELIDPENLSNFAVDTRYPGDIFPVNRENIDSAIIVVKQIEELVTKNITL
jgi:HEPN domain-containing protein